MKSIFIVLITSIMGIAAFAQNSKQDVKPVFNTTGFSKDEILTKDFSELIVTQELHPISVDPNIIFNSTNTIKENKPRKFQNQEYERIITKPLGK